MPTHRFKVSASSSAIDVDARRASRSARGSEKPQLPSGKEGLWEAVLKEASAPLIGQLVDDVALITGAGGGIGRALCKAIAEVGGCKDLVLVGRRPGPLFDIAAVLVSEDVCQAQLKEAEEHYTAKDGSVLGTVVLGSNGVACLVVSACDVSCEENVVDAIAMSLQQLGDITLLVNNAGVGSDEISEDFSQALCDTTWKQWKYVMDINIGGTFLCTREAVAQQWNNTKRGTIVNISSKAGVQGFANIGAYSTSKWAMEGFTKCMALELADRNVRVNSISPGRVETPGFPAKPDTDRSFFLLPEDAVVPFLYLCVAKGVTGTYVHAGEFLAASKSATSC